MQKMKAKTKLEMKHLFSIGLKIKIENFDLYIFTLSKNYMPDYKCMIQITYSDLY